MRKKKFYQFILVLLLLVSENFCLRHTHQKNLRANNQYYQEQELDVDIQEQNLTQLESFQWLFGDEEYADGDQRDWKEYKWTIYELKKIDVKDVFDKCDQLTIIVNQIASWEYFLQDPSNFIEKSVDDLKAFQQMADEIMDARHDMLNQMEDIQDKFNQEEEIEEEEESEDNTSIFDIDIFNMDMNSDNDKTQNISNDNVKTESPDSNNDNDSNTDNHQHLHKKSKKSSKKNNKDNDDNSSDKQNTEANQSEQDSDSDDNNSNSNNDVIEFTQIVKELDPQIQISRNRMMELHNILNNKGKEFKDILLNGPYGGGNDIEDLYEDMTKIFEILYTRYEELIDLESDYDQWEKDLSKLEETLGPHTDSCGLN